MKINIYTFLAFLFSCIIFFIFFSSKITLTTDSEPKATNEQSNGVISNQIKTANKDKTITSKGVKSIFIDNQQQLASPSLVTHASIAGIGDILIHDRVYNKASDHQGGYDFTPSLKFVKPMLEKPDILIANAESKIGGEQIGLSSYPTFNSPYEVGDALKESGVDLVTLANNHAMDRGEKATQNAIIHWNKIGMPYTGAFSSEEDQNEIRTLNRNGIVFSFLAYTYGTNGIPVPKDKSYLVNLIDLKQIKKDIQRAKTKADVVVVSLHFGSEYQRLPNTNQKDIVKAVANNGADIIFGSHPHVLQPVQWIMREDGKRTFVAYSLGNFFSGQTGDYKDIGGMAELDVIKTTKGGKSAIKLKNPKFIPTFVDQDYVVYPMALLPDEKYQYHEIETHMSRWMPELSFKD